MPRRALGLGALARAAILAVLLALFVRTFLIETLEVESVSMSPALLAGDHVLVNRLLYTGAGWPLVPRRPVRRGDVVVLERPGEARLVKRVAFGPGERVPSAANPRQAGEIHHEPIRHEPIRHEPIHLEPNQIYVLGDHLARSRDSRHWGPASTEWLRGRAILIYWSSRPPGGRDHGTAEDWDRIDAHPWSRIRSTRWDRWLLPVR